MSVTILNVGYSSTNYWVISAGRNRLLVDIGYPGTFGQLRANLLRADVPLSELRYALATHYHIDHAGAAEDLKRAGVPLLVLETQVDAIPLMQQWTKPQDNYTPITPDGNVVISFAESRALLAQIGIAGTIVPTPGHSDDCVSLVLDDGAAFIGDLTPLIAADEHSTEALTTSWLHLLELGAQRIYAGHGPVRPIETFVQ